jgi:hypothetical protein
MLTYIILYHDLTRPEFDLQHLGLTIFYTTYKSDTNSTRN